MELKMIVIRNNAPGAAGPDFAIFRDLAAKTVREHPVVAWNTYTRWFARGEAHQEDVRRLTVQFSVFSHQFIEAQLMKVINAADLQIYRKGKEILMNEMGVAFRPASTLASRGNAAESSGPARARI